MNSMANNLINSIHKIERILKEKGVFKKLRIAFEIRCLRRMLYRIYMDKTSFDARDIISFAQLIHVANKLKICDMSDVSHSDNIISIFSFSGHGRYKWPIVGCVYVDVGDFRICIKAHIDSKVNDHGDIDIEWFKSEDKTENVQYTNTGNYHLSYSASVLSKSDSYKIPTRNLREMYEKSYNILNDVFGIFIENIAIGMGERYINDESKNSNEQQA